MITTAALSILSGLSPTKDVNIDFTTPCENVIDAINRLHASLPDEMPLEAKCKRYAILLSMIHSNGVTEHLALLQISGMSEKVVNMLYEEINPGETATRYLNVIDSYRSSHLEPAFMDIIKCSRKIVFEHLTYDSTAWLRTYLDHPELTMIVKLYKQALKPPASAIDLESVDLSPFQPEFRSRLQKLFEKHSEVIEQNYRHNSCQINAFNQMSSSYLSLLIKAQSFIEQTEKRLRQKELRRERQRRFRERHLETIREKNRVRREQERKLYAQRKQLEQQQGESSLQAEIRQVVMQGRLSNRERQRRYRESHSQYLRMKARERRQQQKQVAAPPPPPAPAVRDQSLNIGSNRQANQQQEQAEHSQSQQAPGLYPSGLASIPGQGIFAPLQDIIAQGSEQAFGLILRRRVPLDPLAKSLREKNLTRQRQKRYRERNLERERARGRERERQRRQRLREMKRANQASQTEPDDGHT